MDERDGQHEKRDDYFRFIAGRLRFYQRSGLFCDTALVARDQKLTYAHSPVLATVCTSLTSSLNQRPFFKPVPNVIDLTDFSPDVVDEFVMRIYSGQLTDVQSTELLELCKHMGVKMPETSKSDESSDLADGILLALKTEAIDDYYDCEEPLIENEPIDEQQEIDIANLLKNSTVCSTDQLVDEDLSCVQNGILDNSEKCLSRLRRHRDLNTRPYACAECLRCFKSPLGLKVHVFSVHTNYKNVRPFRCKLCGKTCTTYSLLKKHIDLHVWHVDSAETKSNLVCGYCRKVFKYEQSLRSHIRAHETNGDEAANSELVDAPFAEKFHVGVPKRKPPSKSHICPLCDKGFRGPARLRVHMNRHTGEAPHVCNVCGKGFANAEYIKKHQRIHSGNRGHKCTICDKSFFSPSSLLCHMNTHTGAKPYVCEVCGRGFSQVSSFIKHRKTHSETPSPGHLCQLCGKTIATWSSYQLHMRKHSGERPFACDACDKRFVRLYDLQIHRFEHTQLFPYVCSECDRGFGNGSKLKRHILSAHTPDVEKPFKCSYCSKGFAENYLLKQHWRYHFKAGNDLKAVSR